MITISGNSDLRCYAAENQIDNAMSDVRYPLIKPYHFYFDQTIHSRVVNGTERLEVLLSSMWKIFKKKTRVGSRNNHTNPWKNYIVIVLLTAIFNFTT